jgi:hypothetical protein
MLAFKSNAKFLKISFKQRWVIPILMNSIFMLFIKKLDGIKEKLKDVSLW